MASLRGEAPARAVEIGYLLGLIDEKGYLAGSRYGLGLRLEARAILDAVPAREFLVDVDEWGTGVLDPVYLGEESEALEIARPRDNVIMHVSNIMDK